MLAVQHDNIPIIKKLIAMGCNVHFRCHVTLDNSVVYALQKGNPELLKLLIQGGADINFEHKFPNWFAAISPLCRAVYYFNNAPKNVSAETNRDIWYEVVKVLVDGGANVNAKCGMVSVLAMSEQCEQDKRVTNLLKAKGANDSQLPRDRRSYVNLKKVTSGEETIRASLKGSKKMPVRQQSHPGVMPTSKTDSNLHSKSKTIGRFLNENKQEKALTQSESALNKLGINGLHGKGRRSYTSLSQVSNGSNSSREKTQLPNHGQAKKINRSCSSSTGSSSDSHRHQNGYNTSINSEIEEEHEAYITVGNDSIEFNIDRSSLDSLNTSISSDTSSMQGYDRHNNHDLTADNMDDFLTMVLCFCILALFLTLHINIDSLEHYKTFITMITSDLVFPMVMNSVTSVVTAATLSCLFIMTMYLLL